MNLAISRLSLDSTLIIILLAFFTTLSFGQINVEDNGNGEYIYTSDLSDASLHFYMFDDGYHSFDNNPVHQFLDSNTPADPVAFTSNPYDSNPPPELSIGGGDIGDSNPGITTQDMENMVQIKRSWNLVEGDNNYFVLMFENKESYTINGCIEFHYNENDNIVEYGDILDHYNNWVSYVDHDESDYTNDNYTHRYKWEFNNLKPAEQRFIYIKSGCKAEVFEIVKTLAVMKTECEDTPPIGNKDGSYDQGEVPTYELKSKVSNNPHDPNGIEPHCVMQGNPYGSVNDIISVKYRIFFQNDGENPVEDVFIKTKLNRTYHNITLLASSHSCNLLWTNDEIGINFPGIFLPGTGATDPLPYEMTIGWVDFIVCFTQETTDMFFNGKCIDHSGRIIFDKEKPIKIQDSYCRRQWGYCISTQNNPEKITCDPTLLNYQENDPRSFTVTEGRKAQSQSEILLYPNPVDEFLTIDYNSKYSDYQIDIYNIRGKKIKAKASKGENQISLDLSELTSGLYIMSISSNNEVINKRFVKN